MKLNQPVNIKIEQKLYLIFAIIIVLLLTFGSYMKLTISKINHHSNIVIKSHIPSINLIHSINTLASDYRISEFNHITATTKAEREIAIQKMERINYQIDNKLDKYSKYIDNQKERKIYDNLIKKFENYSKIHKKTMSLSKQQKLAEARKIMLEEAIEIYNRIDYNLQNLVKYNIEEANQTSQYNDMLYTQSLQSIYSSLLIIFILTLVLVFISMKSIADPVHTIEDKLSYNKLKVEFFANLSHELKTPLNLIFSSLQMLNLHDKTNLAPEIYHKSKKYKKIIKQNSYRLLRTVNNLIDITKIDTKSFKLNLENCNIVSIIKQIVSSVTEYTTEKNRKLKLNSELDEKIIAIDPFNIERVLLNLISNAIKFTDPGDKIILNIYQQQDNICISVQDTGVGIPKEQQKSIFNRFGQADKSFSRNNEGSGIGLTLSNELVKMHGGKIKLNSTSGQGSEFIIFLPIRVLSEEKTTEKYNNNFFHIIDKMKVEFADIYND